MISGSIRGTDWRSAAHLVGTIPRPGQVTAGITPNRMTSDLQTGAYGEDGSIFMSPYQVGFDSLMAKSSSTCQSSKHSYFEITYASGHILQILNCNGLHVLRSQQSA